MADLGIRYARSAMLAGISASALLVSSAAFAQDAAPAAAEEQSTGNDIIVTTRRFEERLQDVPISVTAITAQELERQGIEDLTDVADGSLRCSSSLASCCFCRRKTPIPAAVAAC